MDKLNQPENESAFPYDDDIIDSEPDEDTHSDTDLDEDEDEELEDEFRDLEEDEYDDFWDEKEVEEDDQQYEKEWKKINIPKASKNPIGPGLYIVKQGDCMESIAFRAGFFVDTLWNHSDNSQLREKRKNYNALLTGDEVKIPEKTEKFEPCATEERHRFKRKGVPSKLQIRLLDVLGQGRAHLKYILDIDGDVQTGETNGEGMIDCPIPPDAVCAKLILDPDGEPEEYDLTLGGIDPIDGITGIQGRLQNLGYLEEITGELDDRTKTAIMEFQQKNELPETGELDEETQKKLEKMHDL